jgi:hypothetical protein
MNRDYAERRIRDALKSSGGNAAIARQQIINWAMEDTKLLQELVAPHLTGIAAHAVGRVMSMKETPVPKTPAPLAKKPAKGGKEEPFGMEILKAIALGNPAQFGLENGTPIKKQAASQRHIDAIRQMVSKDKTGKR